MSEGPSRSPSSTPRTDAIALRDPPSGVFCDDWSMEQYNDLVREARHLETDLAALQLEVRNAAAAGINALVASETATKEIEQLRYRCARAAGVIPVDQEWHGTFVQLHKIINDEISAGGRGMYFDHLYALVARYLDSLHERPQSK